MADITWVIEYLSTTSRKEAGNFKTEMSMVHVSIETSYIAWLSEINGSKDYLFAFGLAPKCHT